ncbi:MAG: AAA family ATPase, partial [Actinomycetia bacterium]|nr:AAA family ATPase [Actinomycetes bacterium]
MRKKSDKNDTNSKNTKNNENDEKKSLEDLSDLLESGLNNKTEFSEDDNFENEIKARQNYELKIFKKFIDDIPLPTPKEISQELRNHGYFGQERAVKSLSLFIYRHIKRLKFIYSDNIPVDTLPEKDNFLLIGPTGCGKTYMITLLLRDIFKLPYVIVDITSFSETGYVGQDIETIITRLFYNAGSALKTEIGIVFMDEFDKIAGSTSNAVFSGAGTTKDVSGLGVQRELLKLLEGYKAAIPTILGHSTYSDKMLIDTRNISFIASGAFSAFKMISKNNSTTGGIGFERDQKGFIHNKIAVQYEDSEIENIYNFQKYGFLPELIARFKRVIRFDPLSDKILREILQKNIIAE